MIPRSDYRAAEIVNLLTKLLQLLYPAFTDPDCRRRINHAIDTITLVDDATQPDNLHRLFLVALQFTPDTETRKALQQLDQAIPNPMNWEKMLDTFCKFIKALLALFHPTDAPPTVAITIDLRPFTTDTARKTVSPDYFQRHASQLADLLDELVAASTMNEATDPIQLRDTAHARMAAAVEPHLMAWLDFFTAIDATMDERTSQNLLVNMAQQQAALLAIARGLRDLLPEKTNPPPARAPLDPPPTAA